MTRFMLHQAGLALAYFLAAEAGLRFAVVGETVTLVWAPSGIALVAVLLGGWRAGPGILLGAFLANLLTDVAWMVAAGIALGNTLAALAGAGLLQRLARFCPALERRRDVFALVLLGAVLAPMLSASAGVLALQAGAELRGAGPASAWLTWWLGDMMGVLVVAPLLLLGFSQRLPALSLWQRLEAVALLVSLVAMGYLMFLLPDARGREGLPAALAMLPFVIWGALRFSLWGASLVILVFSLLAIWGTTTGHGPFAVGNAQESLLRWCAFTNLLAVTGLLLAASSAEERRSRQALETSHQELERRVTERTAELARINAGLRQEMATRKRLEGALLQNSEQQRRAVGRELHDGLGQQLTSLAFFGATLAQQLQSRGLAEAELAQRIVTLVNQAMEMVRALTRGLYPAVLERAGLRAALRELVDNTNTLAGVTCALRAPSEVIGDDGVLAIHLYRIAQEALGNALKHGHARHIEIWLERTSAHYRLTIRDDGAGFDPATVAEGVGMGLHNLRYRAELLGGVLHLESRVGEGTTVSVLCPVAEERQ